MEWVTKGVIHAILLASLVACTQPPPSTPTNYASARAPEPPKAEANFTDKTGNIYKVSIVQTKYIGSTLWGCEVYVGWHNGGKTTKGGLIRVTALDSQGNSFKETIGSLPQTSPDKVGSTVVAFINVPCARIHDFKLRA
ncbi:hypothetical protein [Reyranella sp.]|uniref:hypothetical protein n=1 Tax=Reyranella sp. TaxID=1929291 RepID=UPI003D14AFF7